MKTTLRIRRVFAALAVFVFALTASAQVYINEILADNETAFDVDGEFPDYIELINLGTNVPISNWKLTTDPTPAGLANNKKTYTFPVGTVFSNRFLVVICDGKTNQRFHSAMGMAKVGETLYLVGGGGGTRDALPFGLQVTDFSLGRISTNQIVQDPAEPFGRNDKLCRPTPGDYNVQAPLGLRGRLRFNEWAPSRGTADDWFELYNPETNAVILTGLVFTDMSTNHYITTNSWIAAGGFIQFRCDDHPEDGADHMRFKLTSSGMAASPPEWLRLYATNSMTGTYSIIHQAFWTNALLGESYGWLPDGNTNDAVVTFLPGKDTPGDSNFLPIDNVLINEVLAHTDPPLEDAIELYNPTSTNVNIGGWWLSDDKDVYNKYRIPPNTIISPGGYIVFYEQKLENTIWGFNTNGLAIAPSFALSSSQGDQVYLFTSTNANGKLNGYRRGVDFPATQNGQSYGRYVSSTGESDFVPMEFLTFGSDVTRNDPTNRLDDFRSGTGAPNGIPYVGPVVVSEIMYHPPDFIQDETNIVQNELDEYVEIYNRGMTNVLLYDPLFPTNTWRLRGDIGFEFPRNLVLGPGKSLLVVNFGPTNIVTSNTFRAKYSVPPSVQIYGGYRNKLKDGGAAIEIERPDFPQPDGFVPYLRVDRVRYNDELPWPVEADGLRINIDQPNSLGYGLTRKNPERYGSDPTNWVAAPPTAGYYTVSNMVEKIGNMLTVTFEGIAGASYTMETAGELGDGNWQQVQQFPPQSSSGYRQIITNVPPGSKRFFRVRMPQP